MAEGEASKELQSGWTWDFVVFPVLGEQSAQLSKKFYCGESDPTKRFAPLTKGADGIDALEQPASCDAAGFDRTLGVAKLLGVESVRS